MPVFKNVSGSKVEVRHVFYGGKPVEHNGEIEAVGQHLVEETEDAYITGRKVQAGVDDKGKPVEVEELRAWPKALWERVVLHRDPESKHEAKDPKDPAAEKAKPVNKEGK